MGKDKKGKQLGKGISQRKDGKYQARYTKKNGDRISKCFDNKHDAEVWLLDSRYNEEHSDITMSSDATVNDWYKVWIKNKQALNREGSLGNYVYRYEKNIEPYIGDKLINEVKPFECQQILNNMSDEGYKGGTIKLTKVVLSNLFKCAYENDLIVKNPMSYSISNPLPINKRGRVLSVDEMERFMIYSKDDPDYPEFLLMLNTGMRIGEVIGLRWSDVDFSRRTISVNQTVSYDFKNHKWRIGDTKTKASVRTIPMTDTVYSTLLKVKRNHNNKKVVDVRFVNYVFLKNNGEPQPLEKYNKRIVEICDAIGMEKFTCHTLRHTFATRCIESGMKPKTLQKILGHASISTTMDTYVHVTDDEKISEMKKVEDIINF